MAIFPPPPSRLRRTGRWAVLFSASCFLAAAAQGGEDGASDNPANDAVFSVAWPGARSISLAGRWRFRADTAVQRNSDHGASRLAWSDPAFDDADWKTLRVGDAWENQGFPGYDGVGWYRALVHVPKDWEGETLLLRLGRPDDAGEAYWNGRSVAKTKKFPQTFQITLPPDTVRFGEANAVAVRVWDWHKEGGLNAGEFALERVGVAQSAPAPAAALWDTGLTDGLPDAPAQSPCFAWGWRDGGTADTRPGVRVARAVCDGKDALGVDIRHPRVAGEYIDLRLPSDMAGSTWAARGADYITFRYRSDGAAGEMRVALHDGALRWGKSGPNYQAVLWLEPTPPGEWRTATLPLSAFFYRADANATPTPLADASKIVFFSLGYRNNELHEPGTVWFSDIRLGRFGPGGLARPVALDGLWRFRLDKVSKEAVDADPAAAEGVGLTEGWADPGHDDTVAPWRSLRVGAHWETQGVAYDGVAWFRLRARLPEAWRGLPLRLRLGMPDDRGEVYFNGRPVDRVERFGGVFDAIVPDDLVRWDADNLVAVRIVDRHGNGGLIRGPFTLGPETARVELARDGGAWTRASQFDPGAKPGRYRLRVAFDAARVRPGTTASYRIVNAFYRVVAEGVAPVDGASGGASLSLSLDAAATRDLFYGEWFSVSGVLFDPEGRPVDGFHVPDQRLAFVERDDRLVLPELPEQWDDTPYGRLRLVDVVRAADNPDTDPHPYKEGGVRGSWVGRRAYSVRERGVRVESWNGEDFRVAENNEHFGYRVGRGQLAPHRAFVLRVRYPEDKARYTVMHLTPGRNYQGTGFRLGVGPGDPTDPYPLSGRYEWVDHLVFTDSMGYGHRGSRAHRGDLGFWVFFHDIGRAYAGSHAGGPAVAEIRLYALPDDLATTYPDLRLPEGAAHRTLLLDWERGPDVPAGDLARYARWMGYTAVSPAVQKWADMAYWRTETGFRIPSPDAWNSLVKWPRGDTASDAEPVFDGPRDNAALYGEYLDATREHGVGLVPRVEYGGSPKLPKAAYALAPDGKNAPVGRFANWGANLLRPETAAEMDALVDELVAAPLAANPQLKGLLWRIRNDRLVMSFGPGDAEAFARATGRENDLPAKTAERGRWLASDAVRPAYARWWQEQRRDFHVRVVERLRALRPDLRLFYYNWDADGWHLGRAFNQNTPEEWVRYYDVRQAPDYFKRLADERRAIPPEKYVDMLGRLPSEPMRWRPELYREVRGMSVLAPVHWAYLADNPAYLEFFRSADGLAVCNMFNYEEKARWNAHHDNFESAEMTPGGPAFAVAEEIAACFHADPNVFSTTTYTAGRAFAGEWRRFAQAFLALPDAPGRVVENAILPPDPAVRVRVYGPDARTGQRRYAGVVRNAMTPATVEVSVPADDAPEGRVFDLVDGRAADARRVGDRWVWTVALGARELRAYRLE